MPYLDWVCDMGEPGTPQKIFSSVQRVIFQHFSRRSRLFPMKIIFLIQIFKKLAWFVYFTAVVMAEWTKLITCLVLVFYEEGKNAQQFTKALRKTIIDNPVDTLKVCVPSLLYVFQNNLLYLSASHLDAATYQVIYPFRLLQLKFTKIPMHIN